MGKREYAPKSLGWWMDERRGELGVTWETVAARAGVSTETLYRASSRAASMRTTTRRGIERALHWAGGSVQQILDGGEPTPLAEPEPAEAGPTRTELVQMVDELSRRVEQIQKRLGQWRDMR